MGRELGESAGSINLYVGEGAKCANDEVKLSKEKMCGQ